MWHSCWDSQLMPGGAASVGLVGTHLGAVAGYQSPPLASMPVTKDHSVWQPPMEELRFLWTTLRARLLSIAASSQAARKLRRSRLLTGSQYFSAAVVQCLRVAKAGDSSCRTIPIYYA